MDYHLDWIVAALGKHKNPNQGTFLNPEGVVSSTQRDVDLLVAFKEQGSLDVHMILLEAKGYASWDNQQLREKAKQLKNIFDADGKKYVGVTPHFCLMSKFPPERLNTLTWPKWMKTQTTPHWLEFSLPGERLLVARSDAAGKPSAVGDHFAIRDLAGATTGRNPDLLGKRDNSKHNTKVGQTDRRFGENR